MLYVWCVWGGRVQRYLCRMGSLSLRLSVDSGTELRSPVVV